MTIAELFAQRRDRLAREEAVRAYHHLYEHFAESAQLYASVPSLSRVVAETALMFIVAADAELADPEPPERPVAVCCAWCVMYRALPEDMKPPSPLS